MPEEKVPYGDSDRDKVCPLRMINARDQGFNPETVQGSPYCKCLKEKCAWWDKSDHRCGVLSICYDIAKARSY